MRLFEKYLFKLFFGAGLLAASSLEARAQQQASAFLNAPATDQGLKLNFNSNGTYSDNLLRFSDIDIAERPDLTPEDYVLDLSGNIAFGRRIGRNQLSFDSSVGYRFHDNNTQLDTERFSGRGLFAWQLGARCSGSLGGQWSRDNGQFETQADILNNNAQTILSAGGQAQCRILGPLQIAGSAVFGSSDNTDATREINNRNDQFYSGSLRYTFGRGSYIGALVSSSITDFTDRDEIVGATDRFELIQYAGEANFAVGRNILLNVQAGITDIQDAANIENDFNGFSGAASLSVPIGTAHTVNLAGSRSVIPLQSVTATFARSTDLTAAISSSWSPRLSSQLTAGYLRRLIESDQALLDVDAIQEGFPEGFNDEDSTYTFEARINYDLGRLIGLNLSYRYSKRTANVESFEFSSNRIMLGLRVNFR
ncbi:outer membrane beta-barrel protein [Kordiimonas sp. SCSIO 12610]|uniref:outer membrane beta-barrel protein n=1 Tax=Kordiimonas sp. SCSIO 12610 TaxID=2829597 RepID=UPI00210C7DF7|nr:outer membrane beta-barrel protein [Kordiimonas sp. SCSIO 12610]UTW55856.1 outer membrane beta-barrel protein [Kordiimonas sp. SCSIO 12610]